MPLGVLSLGLESMQILRLKDVTERTGLSGSTIWRLERAGKFPTRLQLSNNAVGWNEADVLVWLRGRPRGTRRIRSIDAMRSVATSKRST
jgi:prophage regulatory protein